MTTTTSTTQVAPMGILPLIELAANVTLMVLSQQGITPANTASLAAAIEGAINPLITNITSGASTMADVMAGYGALIGVLNGLRQNTSLAPATLTKIDDYLIAAQNATTAFLTAQSGGYGSVDQTPVTAIS